MHTIAIPLILITLASFQDIARETSRQKHEQELALFATAHDLNAALTARDDRIKATLEALNPELLERGDVPGVVKQGSRYRIEGKTRPDLLHIESLIMFLLTDTRHEEIKDDLTQRGFRVGDLPILQAFSDQEARKRSVVETFNEYILSHNTNPKITREYLESAGDKEYLIRHPELLFWTDAEYLAYHNLQGEAHVVSKTGWIRAFMEQLTVRSRQVVLDYIEERIVPDCTMSFGYGISQEELDQIQDGIRKTRVEWGIEP